MFESSLSYVDVMGFAKYNRKFLGPFGRKIQCDFCGKNLKNEDCEMLEHKEYIGGHYAPMYFCYGHLGAWINKEQKEFLLKKL